MYNCHALQNQNKLKSLCTYIKLVNDKYYTKHPGLRSKVGLLLCYF